MRLIYTLHIITIISEAKEIRIRETQKINSNRGGNLYPRYVPVPSGHEYKEGFQQPTLQQPDSRPDEITGPEEIPEKGLWRPEQPRGFASPKDAMYYGEKVKIEDSSKQMLLDLSGTLLKNLAKASQRRQNPSQHQRVEPKHNFTYNQEHQILSDDQITADRIAKEQYFSKNSFELELKRREYMLNWTSCDEFGHNADFHPKDVINIDWIPFYAWSPREMHLPVAHIHRFRIPTIKLVQKYKQDFGPHMNKTIDWHQPKLLMKSNNEMLLIAVDRRGEFDGIPFHEITSVMKHQKIIIPTVNLRLKIVDPHLALMFCEYHFATIMAISGNEPATDKEMLEEAAHLKFRGRGYPVMRDIEEEKYGIKMKRERMEIKDEQYLEN